MLTLDDFIKDLKRVNQFGDEAVTNDEPTADLLRWINRYRKAMAVKAAWSWLIKTFDVNVVAGSQVVTIDATIRRIVAIKAPEARGGRLRKISIKEAMDWQMPVMAAGTDNVLLGYYTELGVDDVTGARKIRVYGNPGVNATLTAYGLKVVPTFGLADIAAQANFLPFPDEAMNLINDLVSARVAKFKGDPNWATYEKVAWDNVLLLQGEEQSDPADDVTTPLPAYYRGRRQQRRGGRVV